MGGARGGRGQGDGGFPAGREGAGGGGSAGGGGAGEPLRGLWWGVMRYTYIQGYFSHGSEFVFESATFSVLEHLNLVSTTWVAWKI